MIAKRLNVTKPGVFEQAVKQIQHYLTKHWGHIQNSPWRALPELTNAVKEYCTKKGLIPIGPDVFLERRILCRLLPCSGLVDVLSDGSCLRA